MKKKKNNFTTFLLVLVLLAGLSLLLYPTVSDYWNSFHQTEAITGYAQQISHLDEDRYAQLLDAAVGYNAALLERRNHYLLSEEQKLVYDQMLNMADDGIMGYIEIPTIGCMLPIYHGTNEAQLQVAIGHLEWTSLPVGGESSHCVLSGHRGLPRAKLFTDLDELVVGDLFVLRVLDEVLTYEVDQILIVEPDQTEALLIEEGKDLCTLVTCTPYGINTHRILVRGHRVETMEEAMVIRLTSDAVQIEPMLVAPVVALPVLLLLLIVLLIPKRPQYHPGGEGYEDS